MNFRSFLLALTAALTLIATPGFAQSSDDKPATAFVRAQAGDVVNIVNGVTNREERLEQLKAKMREIMDFRMLAERTLGPHWDDRTEDQRANFIGLMRELIETSYSRELGNEQLEDDAYRVQFIDERERRGNFTVDSIVEVRGDAKYVSVRMTRDDAQEWRVYDVVTDDVSLVESYAESFDEIINEHGWDELISRIQERIDEMNEKDATE
jgi:phospholipid transport system substrate-binding protein